MKKLLFVFIITVSTINLFSKENRLDSTINHHEIGTYVGWSTFPQHMNLIGTAMVYSWFTYDTGYSFRAKNIPPIGVFYQYNINKKWSVNADFSFARTKYFYNYTNEQHNHTEISDLYSIMLGFKYHYFNKKNVQLYTGANLGTTIINEDKEIYPFPAFQATVFGLKYGKKVSGFLELGYGTKGFINAGISANFK